MTPGRSFWGRPGATFTPMHLPALKRSLGPALAAAVLGNAFVGKDAMSWFRSLDRPAMQIPLPAFATVGALYYGVMGTVLHRAVVREDRTAYRLGLAVLAGNELWNLAFFGRRSARAGLVGLLAFTVPLGSLQAAVSKDRVSSAVLAPYTAWVLLYDLPWAYQLYRLNPDPAQP
jgi:translocator protein